MALKKVGIEFTAGDINPFVQAVQSGNTAVAQFGQVATKSAKSTDDLAAAQKRALNIADLTDKIGLQRSKLANLNDELEKTKTKYGESSAQAHRKEEAIAALTAKIASGERTLDSYQQQIQREYQEQQKATQATQDAVPAVNKLENSTQALAKSTDHANSKINAFSEMAIGVFRRLGELAVNFAIEAGRALIGLGQDTVNVAADYESTLNRFSAVTGDAIQDAGFTVEEFSQKFLKLGADTQYSAQQAADAGVELAKGGVPIAQIMGDATDATLALAAAGELELAPAAEIVAKVLGVWGDEGVTATQTADLLAQAANASTVDVDELALGLYNAQSAAKGAGVDFNELVTGMALTSSGFASAAQNGTAWMNLVTRLQPKTKPATEAMMELGLFTKETGSVFYDAQDAFIGVEKAAGLLESAFGDLSEADRGRLGDIIFGNEAMGAANMLIDKGAEGYRNMALAMDKAGTATAQAAERNKGYKFALDSLKGSFETIQIVIGTAVLPLLTKLIENVLIPGANAVMTFATNLTSAASPFDYLAGAAGRMLAHLGPLGTTAQNLINIFIRGQDTFANWTFLERSLDAVGVSLSTLGTNILAWVGETVPQFRQAMLNFALVAAEWVLDSMPMLLGHLGTFLQTMIEWSVQGMLTFGEQMLGFGQQAVAWIGPRLPELGNQLGQFLNTMVTWVVDSLPGWIAELQKLGTAAIQWVTDALPGLSANLGTMAGNLLGWIGQTAIDVVPKLFDLAVKFTAWVMTDVMPKLPGALDAIAQGIINFIVETGVALGPYLADLAVATYKWVTEDVVPGIKSGFDSVWATITTWVSNTIRDIPGKTKEIGKQLIMGMVDGVTGAVSGLVDSVVGALEETVNAAKDFLGIQSPSRVGLGIGAMFTQGVTKGVISKESGLIGAVTSTLTQAVDVGGGIMDQTQGMYANLSAMISAPAQGYSIHPVASNGGAFSGGNTTNNNSSVTYSPTYNSPAPPPAMSYATLNAMAGV